MIPANQPHSDNCRKHPVKSCLDNGHKLLIILLAGALLTLSLPGCRSSSSHDTTGTDSETVNASINGLGFFIFDDPESHDMYFTKVGTFFLNADNSLVNQEGYFLCGWKLDENGHDMGTLTKITLPCEDGSSHPEIESISQDGIITVRYADGTASPVFRIGIAKFNAPYWLQDKGNYLFSATEESGDPITGYPGVNGCGIIVFNKICDDPSIESDLLFPRLSIEGEGLFCLKDPENSGIMLFTRSGEFYADADCHLVTPRFFRLQGWAIDEHTGETTGEIRDILMPYGFSPPVATDAITYSVTLDSRIAAESSESYLFDNWDGRNYPEAPMDQTSYEYFTEIGIIDQLGNSHSIKTYFDRTAVANQWEFLVTCVPAEDYREIPDELQPLYGYAAQYDYAYHKGAGALMYGLMTFDPEGSMQDISCWNIPPDSDVSQDWDLNRIIPDPEDGACSFPCCFTPWTGNASIKYSIQAQDTDTFSIISQTQNGFATSALASITVDAQGTMVSHYESGYSQPLWKLAMALFDHPEELDLYTDNVFMATEASGDPNFGQACNSGLGCILSESYR